MAIAVGIKYPAGSFVSNGDVLRLYDDHEELCHSIYRELKPPFAAAVHGIAFARACLKYPDRRKDVFAALRSMVAMDFSEPRTHGLRQYAVWATTHRSVGSNARQEAYLRSARALEAYLKDECIGKLYKPSYDPFKIEITKDTE